MKSEDRDEIEVEDASASRSIAAKAVANINHLPRLIPQAVHDDLTALRIVDGDTQEFLISQRDCVENLIRNTFNLSYLNHDGTFKPGAEELLSETPLGAFYEKLSASERISNDSKYGRAWLDHTVGFEAFGVQYDPLQGNREVLTGIDNILALMEGITRTAIRTVLETRARRLTDLCKVLSTDTVRVTSNHSPGILNYADVTLTFKFHNGVRKCVEKVKWLITTEHVCMRHGTLMCS